MKAELLPEQLVAIIDTREQLPLDLEPLRTIRDTLQVGDYSVAGLQSVVAVERKSLGDLVSCCGGERERFQKELDALRGWPVSAVVVESTWRAIEMGGWRSKLTPRQVQASLTSWIAQGHRIILADDHQTAGLIVRDILFFAARYRWREARQLVNQITEGSNQQ